MSDFQGTDLSPPAKMRHTAAITTLALEAHQAAAPELSLVHNFPGAVKSGISRGSIGPLMRILKTVWALLGSLVHIPLEEAGDRHLLLCTNARFACRGHQEWMACP